MSTGRLAGIVIALAAFLVAAWLALIQPAPISLRNVRAVPVPGAQSAMVVLDIVNAGAPDRLIDVRASATKLAVLKSPRTEGLPVPAEAEVSLAMEAGHVMLMGVAPALEEGTFLPLELEFERAGVIAAKARVAPSTMSHGAGFEVPPGEPLPSVVLTAKPDGPGWVLSLEVEQFRFAKDLVDGAHVPGTGHAHLYVSGMKVGRLYETTAFLPAVPPGRHVIEVTLNTNDHRAYMSGDRPIAATVEIVSN